MIGWQDVPGFFDFQEVYDRVVESAPDGSTFVEVGALFGCSTLYMAQKIKESGKKIRFCTVDLWKEWPDAIFNPGTHYRYTIDQHGSLFQAFAYLLGTEWLARLCRGTAYGFHRSCPML